MSQLRRLTKARSGDTACMIFYLKTQGGGRETALVEHSLPPDAAETQRSGAQAVRDALNAMALRHQAAQELIEGRTGTSGS